MVKFELPFGEIIMYIIIWSKDFKYAIHFSFLLILQPIIAFGTTYGKSTCEQKENSALVKPVFQETRTLSSAGICANVAKTYDWVKFLNEVKQES